MWRGPDPLVRLLHGLGAQPEARIACKEKPNTCQRVGFVGCPRGTEIQSGEGSAAADAAATRLRGGRLAHVTAQLAQRVGFDLTDPLG